MKRFYIIFLFANFIITNIYAANQLFILKENNEHKPVYIAAELQYAICNERCITVKQIIKQTFNFNEKSTYTSIKNNLWLIMLSIIGGFILNFMPCVLPVLSLKIISFLKKVNIK